MTEEDIRELDEKQDMRHSRTFWRAIAILSLTVHVIVILYSLIHHKE